jgi:hypothetical protein
LEQIACEEGYTGPPTGYAYALSIPRSASEGPLYVVHGVYPKHDMRPEFSGQAPRNFETESSALPSPGEAVLVVRADHAPVWVVRHPDGSSSALGAEYEPMPEWLPGFRSLVRFQQGRFLGPFDPWGTHLSGAQAGLERYQLRVREGRLEIGASLGRVPPGRPRSTPRSNAEPRALPDFFEGVPRRGVSEALEQPQGTLSVLRGRARLEPGRLAVFCEGDATSFRDCATIVDLRASEDCHGTLSGDFALRREGAGFAHLIALSAGEVAYSCRTDDGERPWWGRGGSFGLAPWTAALSLGAYAGLAGSEPQAGLDASATLRFRHRRSLARSFWDARLGHVFELGVRAHWFDELGEHAQPAWAFGLRPSFTTHHPASAWSSPTLLGSIIPELGVIGRHGESNAYLAWQFPLEYRPYPRRQRPYTADERLAWFVSPQFLLELGDTSERWHAGVSTGVVVW